MTALLQLLHRITRADILRPVMEADGLTVPSNIDSLLVRESYDYIAAAVMACSTRGE